MESLYEREVQSNVARTAQVEGEPLSMDMGVQGSTPLGRTIGGLKQNLWEATIPIPKAEPAGAADRWRRRQALRQMTR